MIINVSTIDDPRLDAYARLTEVQLRNKLEPEKGMFIAESSKVIERAVAGGMQPLSLLMEEKFLPACNPSSSKSGNATLISTYQCSFFLTVSSNN